MDNRSRTAGTLILVQAAVTSLAAVIIFGLYNVGAALAVVAGGGVCIIGTVLFALRLFSGKQEFSPDRFLRRMFVAEFQKIALTVLLFFAIIHWTDLVFAWVLLGFSASLIAHWLVLPFISLNHLKH
jgi:F0F1-type ATP synthase assembly protein I